MSYSSDIKKIAKQDEPLGGLEVLQERSPIPGTVTPPKTNPNETMTLLITSTETVRVYQNNDDTSPNWVDVERMLTGTFTNGNGKKYFVTSVTWPETE